MTGTRQYANWWTLRYRNCDVAPEWLNDAERFLSDTEAGYGDGLYLTRPDTTRALGPDNFAWSAKPQYTSRAQITIRGRTQSKSEWARELGISRQAFDQRVAKSNNPDDWAVSRHDHHRTRGMKFNSKYKRRYGIGLDVVAERTGLSYGALMLHARRDGLIVNPHGIYVKRCGCWNQVWVGDSSNERSAV